MKTLQDRDAYLAYMKELLPDNPSVLEVGVEAGHFSERIMAVLEPEELHLLDPWEVNPWNGKVYSEGHMRNTPTAHSNVSMQEAIRKRYEKEIQMGIVHLHRGYSHDLVNNFQTGYFDFVYLDGCHLYESVKQDLQDYHEKVQPEGILGGHDYISVDREFTQEGITYNNQLGYGIKQAVDEFLNEQSGLELCALVSDEIPFPDWAIRRTK
jgi:hypothetical protein